jgi:hypothetical protein
VLGVVLLGSVPMYPALGMCLCCGGVRLYRVMVDLCFIYTSKHARALQREKNILHALLPIKHG